MLNLTSSNQPEIAVNRQFWAYNTPVCLIYSRAWLCGVVLIGLALGVTGFWHGVGVLWV